MIACNFGFNSTRFLPNPTSRSIIISLRLFNSPLIYQHMQKYSNAIDTRIKVAVTPLVA